MVLFLLGSGEDDPVVYVTDCPVVEIGEHIGYLSIEGVDKKPYVYWGCVDEDCRRDATSDYGVSVRSMGGDILRVSCGVVNHRVDKVNVVVFK